MSADTSHTSEDFSDIDMDELDSYLTSPPVRPADPPRSRERASPVPLASSEEIALRPRALSNCPPHARTRLTADARPPPLRLLRDERRRWSTTTTTMARVEDGEGTITSAVPRKRSSKCEEKGLNRLDQKFIGFNYSIFVKFTKNAGFYSCHFIPKNFFFI